MSRKQGLPKLEPAYVRPDMESLVACFDALAMEGHRPHGGDSLGVVMRRGILAMARMLRASGALPSYPNDLAVLVRLRQHRPTLFPELGPANPIGSTHARTVKREEKQQAEEAIEMATEVMWERSETPPWEDLSLMPEDHVMTALNDVQANELLRLWEKVDEYTKYRRLAIRSVLGMLPEEVWTSDRVIGSVVQRTMEFYAWEVGVEEES